jgi:putative membrane protein
MTRYSFCALVGATAIASQAWANGDHGPAIEQHPHVWGGGGGFGMIFGVIMMIVVIAVIVGVIVLVVRWLAPGSARRAERTAIDILEGRFARGEIDAQEFQDRRRVLDE